VLENSGSDRARFVTAASCAVRLAIQYVSLKTRPQRNDICSALIKIDKGYDVRDNIFKLDMLSPEPKRQRSVGLPAVQNEPENSLFTFDSLRNLTRQYVGKKEDANRLCGLLRAAEEAAARGDFAAKAKFLATYIYEVSAQPHQLDLPRKQIIRATLTLMRYPRRRVSP
jgi:hypothetical protein